MPFNFARKWALVFCGLGFFVLSLGILHGEPKDKKDTSLKSGVFSLNVTPGFSVPIGTEDSELFEPGFYTKLASEFYLPGLPFYIDVAAGYSLTPLAVSSGDFSLHVVDAGGGLGMQWPLVSHLSVGVFLGGGYAFGFIPDKDNALAQQVVNPENTGSTWFAGGGAFLQYKLNTLMSARTEASFRYYGGLRTAFALTLGLAFHTDFATLPKQYKLQKPALQLLKVTNIELETVFPVFYKFYDEHPVGFFMLENKDNQPITNIVVAFHVKEYMDNPKTCIIIDKLEAGEKKRVPIYSLLTRKVLDISESTKVSANILIDAEQGGISYHNEYIETLRLHDRNAMTWDDDRRAAAFVTMKDPTVLKFAKYVSNLTAGKTSRALNRSFLLGLGLFEALRLYGLNYAIDPSSPYKELSQKTKLAVDFLQFPNQTLEYKTGDCDDLSILYCALLEAVGVKTAFVTIPGHIYMAFSLDISPLDAKRLFTNPNELLFIDGNTWLPVEITMVRDGFLKAWPQGARQWREFTADNQTAFYPVQAAWQVYEPVGFSSAEGNIKLPTADLLLENYLAVIDKFVNKELYSRVVALEEKIKAAPDNWTAINQLGVLYARYGKTDEAKAQFNIILAKKKFLPALVNIGHIYYLEDKYNTALQYYEQAFQMDPRNASLLLSLAKTYNELENYKLVKQYYAQLKKVDDTLAKQSSYLELGDQGLARASDRAAGKEFIPWQE